jgi:adenine-specific DNA-methyltransferase
MSGTELRELLAKAKERGCDPAESSNFPLSVEPTVASTPKMLTQLGAVMVQGGEPAEMLTRTPRRGAAGRRLRLARVFKPDADAVLHHGDCLDLLADVPNGTVRLVVTSPPYNIGKRYERRVNFEEYLASQARVIKECVRVLADDGSLCWQVGNFVDDNEIIPLDVALWPVFRDLGLKMRNRIVWHFEHGLHCTRRFSGRYETITWFTKSDDYLFELDAVRVPQKYPGKKHFKGANAGQYSCNPLGKNPGDVWIIPNVKHNHVEKTIHPCQFPVELVERLVLAMTGEGDWVLDPYMGAGTAIAAAVKHRRRGVGADVVRSYVAVAEARVRAAHSGTLRTRPMDRPVYRPGGREKIIQNPFGS